MEHIISNILGKFSKGFFWQIDDIDTKENIEQAIKLFNKNHFNILQKIRTNLKLRFSTQLQSIDDHTHFFRQDRCIRFYMMFQNKETYVMQLSIFGFFCLYRSFEGSDGYRAHAFINQGEDVLADKIYQCIPDYKEFEWLSKKILEEPVKEFSLIEDDPLFSHIITVGDVLFTDHFM